MKIFSRKRTPVEPTPPVVYPHVRWMIRDDLPRVMEIERSVFEFPWTEADLKNCLAQRNCIGMVLADRQERPLGYIVYELHPRHFHLLNLAVAPESQRGRRGTLMLNFLRRKLSWERRWRILTEVREWNLPGQLFFRAFGFRWVRTLRDYYADTPEDAYVLEFRLPTAITTEPRGK